MPQPKIGSGAFAASCGGALLVLLIVSFCADLRETVNPYWVFQVWLAFAGGILVLWGAERIRKGRKDKKKAEKAKQKAREKAKKNAEQDAEEQTEENEKQEEEDDAWFDVGQPTINFIVAVAGATAAIFALVIAK